MARTRHESLSRTFKSEDRARNRPESQATDSSPSDPCRRVVDATQPGVEMKGARRFLAQEVTTGPESEGIVNGLKADQVTFSS